MPPRCALMPESISLSSLVLFPPVVRAYWGELWRRGMALGASAATEST